MLPIFGANLFTRVPSTFAPVTGIAVSPDYVIGPGDQLSIRAWGQIDINFRATVDRSGAIYIPRVGTFNVAGLRFDQLRDFLRTAISRIFRNFDLTVELGQLRSIQVFVVGQARRPGSYTVSSLSTLVNTLFASGGPSNRGSMRHIQVKRGAQLVTDFDLYDLLLRGDKSKDVTLLPGDVIYIPPVGSQIAVAGSVNIPAIYEIKDGTTLDSAIQLAGGLTTIAAGQKAVIERIDDRSARSVADFQLNAEGLARPIKDGDIVRLIPVSPEFDNAITLRGNVALPGRYPWRAGMRVRDLIPTREALITREYWLRQAQLVMGGQDVSTSPGTMEPAGAVANQAPAPRQTVSNQPLSSQSPQNQSFQNQSPPLGTVNSPATRLNADQTQAAPQAAPRTLSEAQGQNSAAESTLTREFRQNAPEINWDYAVIQRLNRTDLTARLLPFNLGRAIAGDPNSDLELQPGDVLTIFSQRDLRVPEEKQTKFIRLEGEFNGGPRSGRTCPTTASTSGTPHRSSALPAYLYGSEFTRESALRSQQARLDEFIQGLDQQVERSTIVAANNAVNPQEALSLTTRLDSQRRLIDRLRQARATGRIVLELKPEEMGLDAIPDMPLEDGDRFYVPFNPVTVNVLGIVYNENTFLYKDTRRLGYYLHEAGGPTRSADRKHIFVIRADGSVISKTRASGLLTNSFDALPVYPGDSVVVPEELAGTSLLRGLLDWSQVFANFGLGAAAVNVIR